MTNLVYKWLVRSIVLFEDYFTKQVEEFPMARSNNWLLIKYEEPSVWKQKIIDQIHISVLYLRYCWRIFKQFLKLLNQNSKYISNTNAIIWSTKLFYWRLAFKKLWSSWQFNFYTFWGSEMLLYYYITWDIFYCIWIFLFNFVSEVRFFESYAFQRYFIKFAMWICEW